VHNGQESLTNRRIKQGVDVRNHRDGFTLFESIVVLAVMVVAASIAMWSLRTVSGATPLNAAADTVKARWAEARGRAVAEGRPYRFAVMHGTGKFRVAPDSDEFWDGSTSGASSQGDGSQPPLVVEGTLPQNMKFVGAESADGGSQGQSGQGQAGQGQSGSSGGWDCPIVFLPDGTTQQDAEIAFGAQGGKPLVLKVQSATGAATSSR
jgi:prepilin-type N-terminal cleavage/methylation domain-containing protein